MILPVTFLSKVFPSKNYEDWGGGANLIWTENSTKKFGPGRGRVANSFFCELGASL